MTYLSRLFFKTLERPIFFLDFLGVVSFPIAIILDSGGMLEVHVAYLFLSMVAGLVLLRALASPYRVWSEDQEIIKKLRHDLAAPDRERAAFVAGYQSDIVTRLSDALAEMSAAAPTACRIKSEKNYDRWEEAVAKCFPLAKAIVDHTIYVAAMEACLAGSEAVDLARRGENCDDALRKLISKHLFFQTVVFGSDAKIGSTSGEST